MEGCPTDLGAGNRRLLRTSLGLEPLPRCAASAKVECLWWRVTLDTRVGAFRDAALPGGALMGSHPARGGWVIGGWLPLGRMAHSDDRGMPQIVGR